MSDAGAAHEAAGPGTLALTRLLLGIRLRSSWHRVRAQGRAGLLVPVLALVTPVSYVGLMTQALLELRRGAQGSTDADGLAIALMGLAVVVAGFANRLASGLSLLATLPENELLLSRPVSLARLAVARVLASTLVDPVGSLFLLPLWAAPILVWRLSGTALLLTGAISVLIQLTSTSGAQLVDVALSRLLGSRARARLAFGLRLLAVAALALLWIAGTEVLRTPGHFREVAPALRPWLEAGPAHWIAAPLLAWRAGDGNAVLATLAGHAAAAAALLGLTAVAARFVARSGWEEPSPTWSHAQSSPTGAVLTAWRRELRLLHRDRNRLALIVLVPVTFVAVPLLTSQGWAWTSASPHRLAMLVFSMLVYLAASGPLLHMQGEQRAFWILQTVPVSLSRLFALKAAVWSALFALLALMTFVALTTAASLPVSVDVIAAGVLLLVGCVGLAFLAVGLGATAVDFSDPSRPALGPGSFYAFLFVAGLYNLALAESHAVPVRGTFVFALATAATWQTGVTRARWAHDPEHVHRREPRASDAALLVLVAFLAPLAASRLPATARGPVGALCDVALTLVGVRLLGGANVGRAPTEAGRLQPVAWSLLASIAGIVMAWGWRTSAGAWSENARRGLEEVAAMALGVGAREIVLRGVVQRTLEELLRPGSHERTRALLSSPSVSRWAPAAAVFILEALLAPMPSASLLIGGVVATILRTVSGRLIPALAFHLAFVLGARTLM